MSTPEPINPGPCEPWVTGEDVAAVCTVLNGTDDPSVYDTAALAASQVLWELSGRQFAGECERTVRPCVPGCGCWPTREWAWGAWDPWYGWWGGGSAPLGQPGQGRGCCGCLSEVKLAGYPVRAITEVLIDGVAIAAENYRLDQNKYLVYLNDSDGNPQFWPSCQNLARADTEEGTFAVTYTYGADPPEAGRLAAAELACQIAAAAAGQECALPAGVTRVTRQGITVEMQKLKPILVLLPLVNLFLRTYNPQGLRRRSAIWSPEIQSFGRSVGS